MTPFQQRIVDYLATATNGQASRWEIAQNVFPEKWAKRSGRGALIGHIDRAGVAAGLVRLPPKDQYDDAVFCVEKFGGSG